MNEQARQRKTTGGDASAGIREDSSFRAEVSRGTVSMLDSERTIVVDRLTYSVYVRGSRVALTASEFDLLDYLVRYRDRVVTVADIAGDVLGAHSGNLALLVRVHICHLRRALGRDGQLIVTVRRRGYRLHLPAA